MKYYHQKILQIISEIILGLILAHTIWLYPPLNSPFLYIFSEVLFPKLKLSLDKVSAGGAAAGLPPIQGLGLGPGGSERSDPDPVLFLTSRSNSL